MPEVPNSVPVKNSVPGARVSCQASQRDPGGEDTMARIDDGLQDV